MIGIFRKLFFESNRLLPATLFRLLLVLFSFPAAAQTFVFEKSGYESGLPEENITSVYRDHEGLVWAGSVNGLFRYNGYGFRSYLFNASDSFSISNNHVLQITEDKSGRLWVATDHGLCYYQRSHNRFVRVTLKENGKIVPDGPVTRIQVDAQQEIWAGTFQNGVYRIDTTGKILAHFAFEEENGISRGNEITGINRVSRDSLWICTLYGLYFVDLKTGQHEQFNLARNLPSKKYFENTFTCQPKFDPQNNSLLWTGLWGDGLAAFDLKTKTFTTYLHNPANHPRGTDNIVTDFLFSDDHTILACTERGLLQFDTRSHSMFMHEGKPGTPYALQSEFPQRLYKDEEGIIWLATSNGLIRVNPARQYFTSNPLLSPQKRIGPVYMANDSMFCYVTLYADRKICFLNLRTNEEKSFPLREFDASNNEAGDLYVAPDGIAWIGSGYGIFTFDPKTGTLQRKLLNPDPKSPENFLYTSQILTAFGKLYIGTQFDGLLEYDFASAKFTHYTHQNTPGLFSDSSCVWLTAATNGQIWLTGKYKGMMLFQSAKKKFSSFPFSENFRVTHFGYEMSGIQWSPQGMLYISSRSKSVTAIPADTNRLMQNPIHVDASHGVQIAFVYDLARDSSGYCWLGGLGGVYRFAPGQALHYDALSGLSGNNVNGLRVIPGNRIFATGPNVFIKTDFRYDLPKQLRLQVDEYSVLDSVIICAQNPAGIRLRHDQNSFRFQYAAVDFFHPEQIQYRYRLEGHDPFWTNAGTSRTLNYSNLPPGDYVLEIEAVDQTDPARRALFRLPVIIVPAFYQTIWFRVLMTVLSLALLFGIYYYLRIQRLKVKLARLEKENALQRMRSDISSDIHDEIGAGLTRISLQGQASLRHYDQDPEKTRSILRQMVNQAQQLAQGLGEIVWSVSPRYDSLQSFMAFVRNYCHNYLEEGKFEYDLEIDDQLDDLPITPDLRRNLLMILKEALNNASKYSDGNHLLVRFGKDGEKYFLHIEDNGKTYKPSETRTGNGIPGMKARAAKIGWSLESGFTEGKGMRIYVSGPLENPV